MSDTRETDLFVVMKKRIEKLHEKISGTPTDHQIWHDGYWCGYNEAKNDAKEGKV